MNNFICKNKKNEICVLIVLSKKQFGVIYKIVWIAFARKKWKWVYL